MNILILNGDLSRSGGTERVSILLANSLSKHGYKVICVDFIKGGDPFFKLSSSVTNDYVFDKPVRPLFNYLQSVWRIHKLVKKHKPDIFISVETMLCLFSIPALAGKKVRHICWEHFNFFNDNGRYGRRVARYLASKYANDVVTLTARDVKEWDTNLKPKANIVCIPNPSPFPIYDTSIQNRSKVILAVGGLVEVKGYDRLLHAWAGVKNKNNFIINFIGDGPLKDELLELTNKLDIVDSVEFLGNQSNLFYFYKDAQVFCLTSHFEGFPMAMIEAQAHGLACVSFDCLTGPSEILSDTGSFLIEQDDVVGFSKCLEELVNNEQLIKTISKKMLIKAESYQLEDITRQWLKFLENK